ncbi:CAP domain-containing protein [Corynebacterium endometrii]|uniref:Cysteine-rich secretory protein family protein n=1 Tax=Corynebacterium endometrii TaxID=2488819 RepID=A0A4V1CEA0_9CORY|nr:CAP domain-containing protein [Corynebacterium endometrii]QCB27378.1 Cysteine-rich secretory protein family protein [Corynebacterium endometrii]
MSRIRRALIATMTAATAMTLTVAPATAQNSNPQQAITRNVNAAAADINRQVQQVAALSSLLILAAANSNTGAQQSTASDQTAVLNRINEYRRSKGLKPCTPSAKLNADSTRWAQTMNRTQRFEHSGYPGVGENIAFGASPSRAFDQWRNSPGHNRNMLDSRMRTCGVGFAKGTYQGHSGTYSVFQFTI